MTFPLLIYFIMSFNLFNFILLYIFFRMQIACSSARLQNGTVSSFIHQLNKLIAVGNGCPSEKDVHVNQQRATYMRLQSHE